MHSIKEVLEDLKLGKMIVLVDDEDRENEGDLVISANLIRAEDVNFMAKYARGLICLSLTEAQVQRLELPLMVPYELNQTPNKTAFTISIEAAEGVTTGISAKDRAHTIRTAAHPLCKRSDLRAPGHVFPLVAKKGGVLERPGHTEGSIELCRLANLGEAAVICEIINDDGTMARMPDLKVFIEEHNLKMTSIENLIQYLRKDKK